MSGEPGVEGRRTLAAGGLAVEFRRLADRWTHAILVDGLPLAAATEVDGPDETRVVSPTYQEIQLQGDDTALLMGQSGPHHFSAVFRLIETQGGVTLDIDVADRCRRPVAFLAATYLVERTSSELVDAGPSAIEWSTDSGRLRLEAGGSGRVGLAEAGRRATRAQAEGVVIEGSHTHRLTYRWVKGFTPVSR